MKVTRALIEKYHEGRCDAEEKRIVEGWLLGQEEEELPLFPLHINRSKAEERIWNSIGKKVSNTRHPTTRIRYLAGIASCILLICIAGYFFYKGGSHFFGPGAVSSVQYGEKIAYDTLKTEGARKGSLTLSDGTRVMLNAESKLTYPVLFTGSTREVSISGEGYFQVAHDPDHPFIIKTSQTSITVLGTSFNIKAYPEDASTTVVVEDGKVCFASASGGKQLVLTANQRGIYGADSTMKKDKVKVADYMLWKQNTLVFQDETLEEIIPVLDRWYNVSIEIRDPNLKLRHFSGQFHNRPLAEVLSNMAFVIGYHYSNQNGKITIY